MVVLDSPESLKVKRRVEDWRLRLIDLTKRNRAIYFQPTQTSHLRVTFPDMESLYTRLITKSRICDIQQPPTEPNEAPPKMKTPKSSEITIEWSEPKRFDKVLRNLSRRSQTEYNERGIRVLHITFGILRWTDKDDGHEVVSPLLFSPVELNRASSREPYQIKVPPVEDTVLVNPALKLKLKHEHDFELPYLPESEEQTPLSYLALLKSAVSELGWTVEPAIYLGLFSFSKLTIYQDLSENLGRVAEHPIVKALAGIPSEGLIQRGLPRVEDLDALLDPGKTYQILDADSSQQLCIQYAIRGQSYIMHGPPGTGKSQTITNIISECIAAGKSVLFVSEKMAALEVVYNRLKEKDLDEYCLELHSYKANKREVIGELSRVLTEHLKSGKGMSEEEIERLKDRRAKLNEYVGALHKARPPSNMSAYQLLNEISKLDSTPDIPSGITNFTTLDQENIMSLEDKIRLLRDSWIVVEDGASFPWRGCNVKSYSMDVRGDWVNLLKTLIDSAKTLRDEARIYSEKLKVEPPKNLEEYNETQRLANIIEVTPYPPASWFQEADLTKLELEAEALNRKYKEYWGIRDELGKRYDGRFRALPEGTANYVQEAWMRVSAFLQPKLKDDDGLISHLNDLRIYLDLINKEADEWGRQIEKISEILGLSQDYPSINRAREIHRVAQLCEANNRPERSWLDKGGLDEAKNYLEKAEAQYTRRNELKVELSSYNEGILLLDHVYLQKYFRGPGASLLKYLRPSYYAIRSEISKTTLDNKVPYTILQDLEHASELRELLKTIDSEKDEAKKRLGSYHHEVNPNFAAAREAMKNADEVLHLVGLQRAPKLLRDNLCVATKPSEDLIVNNQRLWDFLQRLRSAQRPLRRILPEMLPDREIRIENLSMTELKEWASELSWRLEILHKAIQPPLVTVTSDPPKTLSQLISDIRMTEKLRAFEEEESALAPFRSENYGGLYIGTSTDWSKVIYAISWTRSLLNLLSTKPSNVIVDCVTNSSIDRPKLKLETRLRGIFSGIDELNRRFSEPQWTKQSRSLTIDEVLLVTEKLLKRIDDLQAWVDYNNVTTNLTNEGLGKFVNSLVEKGYSRVKIIDIFRKSIYSSLYNHITEEDPTLRSFRGRDQDHAVDEFRSLDVALIEDSPRKVIDAANSKKPQGVYVEASDSEITLLLKEAAKKRRQMPLRHLFNKIPNLVRRLKPCFLMSPISVSQFILPERLHFDLVIFDEASQIFTEDAVGSIYRGEALIVAGDNKQLPPTSFFQFIAESDIDWEEASDEFGVYDSVLDECMSIGLPVNMLRWHYRSRHDSLILFSNNAFYDNKLVLFPSAIHRGVELGIEFIHVPDGVYDRGGARNNLREAEVVADVVFKHFREHPEKSLGVMTFSISQMNAVKDEIEHRLIKYQSYERLLHEDRLRGFFVKNLENVQGDERDVMIISVGYGHDKGGVMTLNFGPLNIDGGERRLNVAVTRAREKVILISSIKSCDIEVSSTKSVGVRCLRDYLTYAEYLSDSESHEIDRASPSEIEGEVADEIRRLGYIAVPRVGGSTLKVDVGVKTLQNPNEFILGVLLDGEGYRSTTTARDRDRLRSQVLEGMGWNLHRIWSPEWVQKRSTEVERLNYAIAEAEMKFRNSVKARISHRKERVIEKEKVTERKSNKLPGTEPYKMAYIESSYNFSKIPTTQRGVYLELYRLELRKLLPHLVHAEAPIHQEYAFKRLNKALNLKPVSPSHRVVFLETLVELIKRGGFEKRGEFIWTTSLSSPKVRVPDELESEIRPMKYITSEEINEAMLNILIYSMGLSRESLMDETLKMYRARRTKTTTLIMETELAKLLMSKKVVQTREILFAASKKSPSNK